MAPKPALGACVKKRIVGREKNRGGGGKIVILSTSTSTQIPNYKTSKKKNDISKQHSKQATRQEKFRKITKCLLTRFSLLQVCIYILHHHFISKITVLHSI